MEKVEIDRKSILINARIESAKADMKQHANKLIQGFEAADETYPKRAIWELVQNARDLSTMCDIEILLEPNRFCFTHNGKPFTLMTLLSLIKQVSSKSSEKLVSDLSNTNEIEEIKEVGQYGTGFITTHAFGKVFLISGSLLVEDNSFIELRDFQIDRIATDADKLADKLVLQQESVYTLIESSEIVTEATKTTFKYLFSDNKEMDNAKSAINRYTDFYIPIVMTLNSRLNSITLANKIDNYNKSYKKDIPTSENGIFKTPIQIDSQEFTNIYSIKSEDLELEIILPLSSPQQTIEWVNPMSRLFFYFPLIGAENWGMNFIIHSGKFSPTEKRDGLHIKTENSQTKEKEEKNRLIIDKASQLIFEFMKENVSRLKDPINLANISFNTISSNQSLNEYYIKLKDKWVLHFKEFEMVESLEGRIAPIKCSFLGREFLEKEEYFDSIYDIVSLFWSNMPIKPLTKKWTEIIEKWEDIELSIINLKDVAEKIQVKRCLESFNKTALKDFYSFILDSNNIQLFDDFSILPNIKNKFVKRNILVNATSIHPIFIVVADVITPKVPETFINSEFKLSLEYKSYTRKQLSVDMNAVFSEFSAKMDSKNLLQEDFRDAIILLCSTYPSLDNKGIRGELMSIISQYYKNTQPEINITNIEDDKIEYYTPLKCLVRHFLYDIINRSTIESNWVQENINMIISLLVLLSKNKEFEEIVKTLPIYPNQNYQLRMMDSLMIEEDNIHGQIKELYKEVLNKDIKEILSLKEISSCLPNNNKKNASELANEISNFFETQGSLENINDHPSKSIILKIINKFSDKANLWSRLFTGIYDKRATIMMAMITQEDMKNDLFSIIGLGDKAKISQLGELARNEDMVRIIELGTQRLEEEKNKDSDFQFKKSIGTHIEYLLLNKISNDLHKQSITVAIDSEQNGQDIIIRKNGQPIYYIEVKSRRNIKSSITLSIPQMNKSVKHKEIYALCCVDMCDYSPEDGNLYYPEDITKIMDRILVLKNIGLEVEPLISKAILFEKIDDSVKLTGDYRALVPQPLIRKNGIEFDCFIQNLIDIVLKA